MRFGDKQVPLTLRRDDPLNAAAALIEIELAHPVHGGARYLTPAFCDDDGGPGEDAVTV